MFIFLRQTFFLCYYALLPLNDYGLIITENHVSFLAPDKIPTLKEITKQNNSLDFFFSFTKKNRQFII